MPQRVDLTEARTTADDHGHTLAQSQGVTAQDDDVDVKSSPSDDDDEPSGNPDRRRNRSGVLVFVVLPLVALVVAAGAAFLRWQTGALHETFLARTQSLQTARDSTVEMLSYQPDKVDEQLSAARDLLTGDFLTSYSSLIHDVVIPGAKQQQISSVATVPAAASLSATARHAVALVFVDQTVAIGNNAPSNTASSVKVTLDKIGDRWLISGFDPV